MGFDGLRQALDAGRYDRFAAFLVERGLIEEVVDVATYTAVPR